MARPAHRPSSYTLEQSAEICELLASGISLVSICKREGMPDAVTVFRWLSQNEDFRNRYAQARERWADAEFERMLQIADTPLIGTKQKDGPHGREITTGDMVEHRKLQIDTRKWALARMSPKKYGDKIVNELTGPDGAALNMSDAQLAAAVNKLLATAQQPRGEDAGDAADLL